MHQAKLSTALGFVLAAVLLGTAVDAILNLGDSFKGSITTIDNGADGDIVQFAGVQGSLLSVSVKAAKSDLIPEIQVIDLTTMNDLLAPVSTGKKKISVKKIEMPNTGMYEVRVKGAQATIGAYTMKTGEKLKGVTKPKNEQTLGPGQIMDTPFGAKPGYVLSGTVAPSKKSDALPGIPTITAPSAEGGPVPLTGMFNKKGAFVIADLTLEELGNYIVSVENEGLSGMLKAKLKLNVKTNKPKKKTVEEVDD